MSETVYILINEAMPGLIKIGRTNGDLAARIRQLFSTSLPLPFELFYACEVNDGDLVESRMHDAFDDHRVSKSREFFRLAPERAKAALSLAALREVTLDEGAEFETSEVKEEVEAAKRRARFKLSMIGVQPGSVLKLAMEPTITCVTVDTTNKVEFRGEVTSLSDAALQAVTGLGHEWPSVSGPWEWTINGKRLDDIRREIEEGAD